tara:strand:+ start:4818 stop:5846 length:1029 start_codon:yes stop_codon:yes gene_type:complete
MRILITGGCGFVGSNLAIFLKKKLKNSKILSLDNLYRKGSKINLKRLNKHKIKNFRLNIDNYKGVKKIPKVDLVLDCCAEPAIEISRKDPDRVINTNFIGTHNILKKCIKDNAKIIFLSSSRVYSIPHLRKIVNKINIRKPLNIRKKIHENFSTEGIKSIYGLTKLSSEELIKEINYVAKVKYIINRLGVITGPWQFGKQDQGFVSMWVAKHFYKKKISYIGFGGHGNQIRDIIHIDDVCNIIFKQIKLINKINNQIFNIGGGLKNALSLNELTDVCRHLTNNKIYLSKIKKTSLYDVPYFVTNNSKIKKYYNWQPKYSKRKILSDIFNWIEKNKQLKGYFL